MPKNRLSSSLGFKCTKNDYCSILATHLDKQLNLKRAWSGVRSVVQWNRQGWQKKVKGWKKKGPIVVKVWFWATPWKLDCWEHQSCNS
jgi:hypothetical protein